MISEQYKEIFADDAKVADLAKKILDDGYIGLDNFLTEVIYQPHTMYIFFGDLSFHGVDPIKSGERVVVTINSHW